MIYQKGIKSKNVFLVGLILISNCVFAYSNDPNVPNDPNASHLVWVTALEKESEDDLYWNPTLYKISIEEARIIEKKKIAEQGAPIFCYSIPDYKIEIILCEGIAANGTCVGKATTNTLIIDKNNLQLLENNVKEGYDDPQKYRELVRSDKDRKLAIDRPEQFEDKGNIFLGSSKISAHTFKIKKPSQNDPKFSFDILDSITLKTKVSIPFTIERNKLGSFLGIEYGDVILIEDRYLVCLFNGDSSLGVFAPGYVVIIDIETKTVKFISIGSNPARGIAY